LGSIDVIDVLRTGMPFQFSCSAEFLVVAFDSESVLQSECCCAY
jgi:hypothetical protein